MQYARCDNARENDDFIQACKWEGMCIQFKYTATGTPQQKDQVEQKFETIFYRVHAMLNGGKFFFLRGGSWAEAVNIAALFENKLFTAKRDLSPL